MMICPHCNGRTSIEVLTNKPFRNDNDNYYIKCQECLKIIRIPKVGRNED
jgi:uncharacterized Zn finger protein